MTNSLGDYIDRRAVLDAIDHTHLECNRALRAAQNDTFLSAYVAGLTRAFEIVAGMPTVQLGIVPVAASERRGE